MLRYVDSDIFGYYNRGNAITNWLSNSLKAIDDKSIVNQKLDPILSTMARKMKRPILTKVIGAVRNGELLLIKYDLSGSKDPRFPETIPFVKIKKNGKPTAIIDITRICRNVEESDDITIDQPKLYVLMVSAYFSLKLCGINDVLPAEANKHLSFIYAKMFCQVLSRMGMLTSDVRRHEAFMYFTIEFFLTYYAQCPYSVVQSTALSYVGGQKNDLIRYMEDQIQKKEINPFTNFTEFSRMLYDNEITGIRTAQTRLNDVNESAFLAKFLTMYSKNALIALWSIDYLFYILLGVDQQTNVVFDKAFVNIFRELPKSMTIVQNVIFRELASVD